MSAVADKLREARALLAKGWTQNAYARDVVGNELFDEKSSAAVCWCASGALFATGGMMADEYSARSVLRKAIDESQSWRVSIPGWNDAPERTQAEVLAAFDKAIELAERDQ